jgi:hypothetical protein
MGCVTVSAASAPARAEAPRSLRRAVEVPALADLQGPRDGLLIVPRRLYWSGDDQCGVVDLRNEDEIALAYEAIIDAARTTADLAGSLNAELLVRVWSTLGIVLARREVWEAKNPELALARVVSAAIAA